MYKTDAMVTIETINTETPRSESEQITLRMRVRDAENFTLVLDILDCGTVRNN